MKVVDILDKVAKNYLRDRAVVIDGPTDRMWDDDLLLAYFNEGYINMCAETHCYRKRTSISVGMNVGTVMLPVGMIDVYQMFTSQGGIVSNTATPLVSVSGTVPKFYMVNSPPDSIALYPATSEPISLDIYGAYIPDEITDGTLDSVPNVPIQYHMALADYVAYRALSDRDVDGQSDAKAAGYKQRYDHAIAMMRSNFTRVASGRPSVMFTGSL